MTQTLTLRRTDDWHLHLRDGANAGWPYLPYTPRNFAVQSLWRKFVPPWCAVRMPASLPWIRILGALPENASFSRPLMTLYLTEDTDPDDVAAAQCQRSDHWVQALTLPRLQRPTLPAPSQISDNVAPVLDGWPRSACPVHPRRGDRTPIDYFSTAKAVFIEPGVLDPIRSRPRWAESRDASTSPTRRRPPSCDESTGNLAKHTITTQHLW